MKLVVSSISYPLSIILTVLEVFVRKVMLIYSITAPDSEGHQSKRKHNLLPSGQYKCFTRESSCYHLLVPSKMRPRYVVPSSHYPLLSIGHFVIREPQWFLRQRSPTFLAPGTSFVEDNFSTDQGGGMALG